MSTHPAPHRKTSGVANIEHRLRADRWRAGVGVQFCAGYALAEPRLLREVQGARAPASLSSAQPPILWISIARPLVALASTGMAFLLWRRTRAEAGAGIADLWRKARGAPPPRALGTAPRRGSAGAILRSIWSVSLMVPPCAGRARNPQTDGRWCDETWRPCSPSPPSSPSPVGAAGIALFLERQGASLARASISVPAEAGVPARSRSAAPSPS